MGLASALNSTVSALRAQSTAIAAVSENISNSDTTAYKIRQVTFESLVGDTSNSNTTGGGVLSKTSQIITQSGEITTTGVSTNVAISGSGFFVVTGNLSNKAAAYTYTRNGDFSTDSTGNLVNNEGSYLLGQTTNNQGVVTATNANDLNSLVPINVSAIQGAASPTKTVTEKINLPADAPIGSLYTSSFELFDSLGISNTVNQTWTKTASNAWTMTLSNPVLTTNPATVTGTMSTTSFNFTFNGDGSLKTVSPSPGALTVTFAGTGANTSTLAVDVGTPGLTDGVTQFSSNSATPSLEISSITGDGVRFGKLTGIDIADSGLVTAVFDNGLRQPVYQIPVATFPNANGLQQVSGSVYAASQLAGVLTLQDPNVGSAGSLVSKALEGSNTDISEEFNKLIVAQQAYSAAAQIITTVKTLSDALNRVIG